MRLPRREVIGPPDCPILYRWTLLEWGRRSAKSCFRTSRDGAPVESGSTARWKLMVHRFPPNADDRDAHDHPRPFVTLMLWGGYDDLEPCDGDGSTSAGCDRCASTGWVVKDRLRAGSLRSRDATYVHRTRVLPSGAWTVVLMGPLARPWGFWREGLWWYWKDYEREFGFAMRCEDLQKEHRR